MKLLLSAAIFIILALGAFKLGQPLITPPPAPTSQPSQTMISYASKDLAISLQYPKRWVIDDRYQRILLASFDTNLNRNVGPTNEQIELEIKNFSNCFPDFERDLIEPACGEGGAASKRTIITKETKQTPGGTFYKYVLSDQKGAKTTYYLLKNADRLLQISKQPDPSKFEKEFSDIVASIRFL